jgi:membrane dipeptidase
MQIDRRTMMAGSAALAPRRLWRTQSEGGLVRPGDRHRRAGRVGDPYRPKSSCALATAPGTRWSNRRHLLRDTVIAGRQCRRPWGDYRKGRRDQAEHPQRQSRPACMLVRTRADILKAKREKKFAWVLGTQDTSMVGPSSTGWRR